MPVTGVQTCALPILPAAIGGVLGLPGRVAQETLEVFGKIGISDARLDELKRKGVI